MRFFIPLGIHLLQDDLVTTQTSILQIETSTPFLFFNYKADIFLVNSDVSQSKLMSVFFDNLYKCLYLGQKTYEIGGIDDLKKLVITIGLSI